jgi:triosephosphate isomerase
MRKIIIAGNWKMNKNLGESVALANEIKAKLPSNSSVEVVICPTFTNLESVCQTVKGSVIKVGGQNFYPQANGAFTGEISADMLKSVGCTYVIIGHSERREYFGETNEFVNQKVKYALNNGLIPIMCCGETLGQRESNETFNVIQKQIEEGLTNLKTEIIAEGKQLVIAYEPIWAIGTGKVATPEQAQEVHGFIRQKLAGIFNPEIANKITIQYGGSVNAENIDSLITKPDIDGALIGGASLKAETFCKVIELSKK